MTDRASTSYDELPYTDNSFPYTHPDHMAAVARLHGLDPAPIAGCRVLELGCAMGGNLIPMALKLPGARFVGVDLSARQVEEGRATVQALGLGNVDLRAMSLADVGAELGTFDFIVCHGVYSWVPGPIRDKILAVLATNLAPQGLGYVSYNTFPGWHARGLARDLMAFHVRAATDRRESARSARGFLRELVEALPDPSTAYAAILRAEGEFLEGVDDAYLYHEHLEETNQPVYFHQFMADAAAAGLAYVAEAKSDGMLAHLPPRARDRIAAWSGDELAREQYLDFVINRTFRRTFLRRAADAPAARPEADLVVPSLHVGALVMPDSRDVDFASDVPVTFRGPGRGVSLTTNHPLLKTALLVLAESRPRLLPFEDLLARVRDRLAPHLAGPFDEAESRLYLSDALRRSFAVDLVALNAGPPALASTAGERPVAGPLARHQAERGRRITNVMGRSVEPDAVDRLLLPWLDGLRDREALASKLKDLIASGEFSVSRDGRDLAGSDELDRAVPELIAASLGRIAAMGLLLA